MLGWRSNIKSFWASSGLVGGVPKSVSAKVNRLYAFCFCWKSTCSLLRSFFSPLFRGPSRQPSSSKLLHLHLSSISRYRKLHVSLGVVWPLLTFASQSNHSEKSRLVKRMQIEARRMELEFWFWKLRVWQIQKSSWMAMRVQIETTVVQFEPKALNFNSAVLWLRFQLENC